MKRFRVFSEIIFNNNQIGKNSRNESNKITHFSILYKQVNRIRADLNAIFTLMNDEISREYYTKNKTWTLDNLDKERLRRDRLSDQLYN
jgi:hypothetical protein